MHECINIYILFIFEGECIRIYIQLLHLLLSIQLKPHGVLAQL